MTAMDWKSPFIVYRISADGKLEEVFRCEDMKKAKYWLTYIAQTGDVLCRTPVHPKHSKKSNQPEYWCHKEASSSPSSEESAWREWARSKNTELIFPERELGESQTLP